MFDVNPNNGGTLYQPGDTLIATNLVYRRNELPSRVIVPYIDQATDVFEFNEESKDKYDIVIVYPNPANDFINFDIKGSVVSYEIFNSIGGKVIEGETEGPVNVSGLPAGVYFAKISSNLLTRPLVVSFCISR
jgi:hypothetical protein